MKQLLDDDVSGGRDFNNMTKVQVEIYFLVLFVLVSRTKLRLDT